MPYQQQRKPVPALAARSTHGAPLHQVRIIGGQWKRTPLPVPDAEGLRPTPDRVRETVFNWLNHLLNGAWNDVSCLDLFAGTGVLGFEAASRGAGRIVMVEAEARAVRRLEATKAKLHAEQVAILHGDALETIKHMAAGMGGARFDVIFLDPPYHHGWLGKILPGCKRLLRENGLVYVESEKSLVQESAPEWLADWEIIRADKAGMVFYHLLRCKSEPDFEA
jgi:16S rRNA (guanine(966)-N(2))-methyltransferase RsmD